LKFLLLCSLLNIYFDIMTYCFYLLSLLILCVGKFFDKKSMKYCESSFRGVVDSKLKKVCFLSSGLRQKYYRKLSIVIDSVTTNNRKPSMVTTIDFSPPLAGAHCARAERRELGKKGNRFVASRKYSVSSLGRLEGEIRVRRRWNRQLWCAKSDYSLVEWTIDGWHVNSSRVNSSRVNLSRRQLIATSIHRELIYRI